MRAWIRYTLARPIVRLCATLIVGAGVASSGAEAEAQEADASPDPGAKLSYEKGGMSGAGVVAGAKLGGGFGAPFNQLDAAFVGELELGYNLPFMDRALGVFLSGQYVAPSMQGDGIVDPYGFGPGDPSRLPGEASYTLEQQQAVMTLGLIYRVPLSIPMFRPYGAIGGRYLMMKTAISGEAGGEPFGTNEETAGVFGMYGALGGELYLGPGAVLLEMQWSRAHVEQYIMRNTNVSTLNAALGYRIFL